MLAIWSLIGTQSFGGGPTTLQLIRQEMVTKRPWLAEADFWRFWAFCPLVPGINLIAFAILIGQRLAGWRGILATLVGMLVPSSLITALLTAGFTIIQQWPPFQAMLRGIVPATAGLMLVFVVQMGGPPLKEARSEGWWRVGATLGFVAGAILLLTGLHWPVVAVLLTGVGVGAFLLAPPSVRSEMAAEQSEGEEARP